MIWTRRSPVRTQQVLLGPLRDHMLRGLRLCYLTRRLVSVEGRALHMRLQCGQAAAPRQLAQARIPECNVT